MKILQGQRPPGHDRISHLVDELVAECKKHGGEHIVTLWGKEDGTFGVFHPALEEHERELMAEELEPVLIRAHRNLASMQRKVV